MKYKSNIIVAGSGSTGGSTFSHNRFGQYIRNRSVPVNPNTSFQQIARNAFASLVTRWTETLTAAQRTSWETYAANVPVTDAIGNQINLTGQNMYVRSNVPRVVLGLAIVDVGPAIFDLGTFTPPTIIATASTDVISVAFADTDAWVGETGSAMTIAASRPVNPTRNFFNGPYRLQTTIEGDATTPPTSPATFISTFPFEADQKVGVQVRVTRADGRLSTPFQITTIAV